MSTHDEIHKMDFSSNLVNKISKLIATEVKINKNVSFNELAIHFITCFVGSLVYTNLTEKVPKGAPKTRDAALRHAEKNFKDIKTGMQNSMAAAFQGALSTYSGQPVDYYCQIKPVPEPANKLAC